MTAAELQLRTVEPAACRCLGLDLLPLTIGHRNVMRKLGCFPPSGPAELAMCCLVCSMDADKVLGFMNRWLFRVWLWAWGIKVRGWDYDEKLAIFSDYIRYNTELPVVKQNAEGCRPSVLPFDLHLRVMLQERLGFSSKEVDRTRFLDALWLRAAIEEKDGTAEYLDKTEDDVEAEIESIDWDRVLKVATTPKEASC